MPFLQSLYTLKQHPSPSGRLSYHSTSMIFLLSFTIAFITYSSMNLSLMYFKASIMPSTYAFCATVLYRSTYCLAYSCAIAKNSSCVIILIIKPPRRESEDYSSPLLSYISRTFLITSPPYAFLVISRKYATVYFSLRLMP